MNSNVSKKKSKLWHICEVNKINELQLHLKIWKISETILVEVKLQDKNCLHHVM